MLNNLANVFSPICGTAEAILSSSEDYVIQAVIKSSQSLEDYAKPFGRLFKIFSHDSKTGKYKIKSGLWNIYLAPKKRKTDFLF